MSMGEKRIQNSIFILGVLCATVLADTQSQQQNETTTTTETTEYPSELLLNTTVTATTTATRTLPTTEMDMVNKDEYEVVDVVHKTHSDGKIKAVQTTRTYAVGALDDNFWLKHLGEDFKHAIQLQVGGIDQYSDLNATKDGVHEEIHHEYLTGPDMANPPLYNFAEESPPTDNITEGTTITSNSSASGWQPPKQSTSYPKNPEYQSIFTLDASGINLAQNYIGDNTNDLQSHNNYKQAEDNDHSASTRVSAHEAMSPTFSLPSKYAEIPYKSQILEAQSHPSIIIGQHPYVTETDVYISAPGQDTLYQVHDDDLSKNADLPLKATYHDYGARQQRAIIQSMYDNAR